MCVWACRRISADQRASDHHLHQLQLIRHPIYSHHSLISFVRSLFVVLDVWCSRLQSCSCSRGLCIPDSSRHFGCALDSSRHFRTPLHSTHLTIKVPSLLSWFCEPAPIFLTGGLIKSIYSHTVSAFLSWQYKPQTSDTSNTCSRVSNCNPLLVKCTEVIFLLQQNIISKAFIFHFQRN